MDSFLNSVTQARKVKVSDLDRRNYNRRSRIAAFAGAHALRNAHRFQVVQHEDRRIVEAEVLHRPRDLAVLDQKRAVAREAGVENRAWIDRPQIPESCYQQTTLRRTNQVLERRGAAIHLDGKPRAGRRAS